MASNSQPLVHADTSSIGSTSDTEPNDQSYELLHSLQHNKSILALVVSDDSIFVGSEGGEILVFDLDTFKRRNCVVAHDGSVLGLCLSFEQDLLFSCGADHFIWDADTLQNLHIIYSTYDIGDVFCVVYSSDLETLYFGTQNASIQWYDLKEKNVHQIDPDKHPLTRQSKFWDSKGPGGSVTPKPQGFDTPIRSPSKNYLQINRNYVQSFAHYGYVYAMILINDVTSNDDEEILITGGGDGNIKIWSLLPDGNQRIRENYTLGSEREDRESVLSLAVDQTFLISGRLGGEINMWDLETRHLIRKLKSSVSDVFTLAVGPDRVFSGGCNGFVEHFDSQYEKMGHYQAHNGRILASAYKNSQNRSLLFTGSNDDSIKIWNVHEQHSSQVKSNISNERLIDKLRLFISHRTISSDPKFQTECRKGASFLKSLLRDFGADTELLVPDDQKLNPVVYALFRGHGKSSKKPRILFYGHYDVVTAARSHGKWKSDPFRLEGVNEYLYGRGVSDNKGPLLAAIYAVAELISEQALEADVLFLVEGEEECGSRGFESVIRKHKQKIGPVDWILLANSYWLNDNVPCLTYGLRGVIHATLEVTSDVPDRHSGVDGSSLMDESLKDLVMLLSKLMEPKGKVRIPGFYDPILPLSKSEATHYKQITKVLVESGDSQDELTLARTLQQKWREASLTIHRFDTSGPENTTIISREAKVAISLRLVPNQSADQVSQDLIDYLEEEFKNLETSNKLAINIDHKAEPWLGDYTNSMYKTLEAGIMRAWYQPRKPTPVKSALKGGKSSLDRNDRSPPFHAGIIPPHKPLYIREGGSIPAIRFLEKEFGAPAAHFPCGQSSDSAHLDNERLRLVNLYKSRDVFKWVFSQLAKRET